VLFRAEFVDEQPETMKTKSKKARLKCFMSTTLTCLKSLILSTLCERLHAE
jgi:hypothetical protein